MTFAPTRSTVALPILLWAASSMAAAGADPAQCSRVTDSSERLACFDRLFPTPAAAVAEPSATAANTTATLPTRAERRASGLAEQWELDPAQSLGTFNARPYKTLYALPVVTTNRINRQPTSGGIGNSVPIPLNLDDTESKFQFSLKTKVWETVLGTPGSLWVGYTQTSRWQVYTPATSRPFRETNYEPELLFIWPTDYSVLGWRGRVLGLSFNHQSNGRALPLSRSWNRLIGQADFERGDWTLSLRPWWRVKESDVEDDNPNIQNTIGRAELLLTRRLQGHALTLQVRSNLRASTPGGSVQFDWAFPLLGTLKGHVQLFHGYGESMIDFNFKQSRAGLGVSLAEWR